ncbi:MAG TPA: PQQ-binding-like beta-propeller repeat protein, partial [Actinomycetota bacterium]|nr:PQQ-binding-like beta-propeller repeat protein [Actinomycetota bacterium]
MAEAEPDPDGPAIVLDRLQVRGGYVGGSANLDGQPGDELLLSGISGGFYVAGGGRVLWKFEHPGATRPRLIEDVTGDGRPDVAASTGSPGEDGEVLVLNGSTGEVLSRRGMHSPVGRIGAGDLNGDGSTDIVIPSVDGTIQLVALFGPSFSSGWTSTLPGTLNAYWVFAESLDVGNLDADPADEVVFGTRLAANAGGQIHALDGGTGQLTWSTDTGAVFALKIAAERVAALVWQQAGVTFRAEMVAVPGQGGAPAWTLPLAGHLKASNVTVADVDADGQPELVAGTTNAQEGSALFGLDPSTTMIYAVGIADGRPRWASKVNRELSTITAVPRPGGGSDIAYGTNAWLSTTADEQVGLLSGTTGGPVWIHMRPSETSDDAIQGVAMADLDGNGAREVAYAATEHKVVGLAPGDGAIVYKSSYPGIWTASAAGDLDDDARLDLVGGGASGLVEALGSEGQTLWSAEIGGVIGGLRISGGSVLAVSLGADARIVSLDPRTGAQRWSYTTGVAANNPFSIHQQSFGDLDLDGVDDVVVGGSQNLRPVVIAVSGRTGQLLWRSLSPITPPGSQPATWLGSTQSVQVVGSDVAVYFRPLDTREPATPRLALLNGVGGAPRWSVASARGDIDATIVHHGDQIVFAFVDRYLSVRNLADGAESWTADLGGEHVLLRGGQSTFALSRETGLARTFSAKVLSSSGVTLTIEKSAVPGARAAAYAPGTGIVYASDEGLMLLDDAAL